MRDFASSRMGRWTSRAALTALLLFAWAVIIPEGYVWTGLAVVGAIIAAALILGGRSILSIAAAGPVAAGPARGVVFPERVAPLGKDGGLGARGE